MRKKILKALIFIIAFQVEVRVRASGDVLQRPNGCLKAQKSCALFVTGPVFHLKRGALQLHANENSSLMRDSDSQWKLLKGTLWVEKAPEVQVETPFATVRASRGQYWLLDQGKRVVVRNVDAELEVILKDGKKLEVPTGFEFWVSGINSKGQSEYGMLQPIDFKEHLTLWNSLYPGDKKSFLKEVQRLKEEWGDLAERSAGIYQQLAERKLASQADERAKAEEARRKEVQRRQRVRDLYFSRTFER